MPEQPIKENNEQPQVPFSVAREIKIHYPEYWGIQRYPATECAAFCKVDNEWGILGNYARIPIVVNDVKFKKTEQLFQLMKFRYAEAVQAVYEANNPKMTAKHWQKNGYCRPDWGGMMIDAMKFCLLKKYEQSQGFRDELERSKGRFIVEDQTTFPKKEPNAWGMKLRDDGFFEGPNVMGRLLMELRDKGTLEYQLPNDALDFIDLLR